MNVGEFEIRRAEANEFERLLPRISEISARAFSAPPWNLQGGHEERMRSYLAFSEAELFLSENAARQLVGFSIAARVDEAVIIALGLEECPHLIKGDHFHLWRAVDPSFKNRGLGRALAVVRLERAKELGYRRSVACSDLRNFGTLLMYRALEFEELGRYRFLDSGRLREHVYYGRML